MSQPSEKPNRPELKIGPFAGGISVEIWCNHTNDGRYFRSITIAPRSYRDEAGNWQEAKSYRPIDLAALILVLQKAQEYCTTTSLPGQSEDTLIRSLWDTLAGTSCWMSALFMLCNEHQPQLEE